METCRGDVERRRQGAKTRTASGAGLGWLAVFHGERAAKLDMDGEGAG